MIRINLMGVAIGNGVIDEATQVRHHPLNLRSHTSMHEVFYGVMRLQQLLHRMTASRC